MFAGMFALVGFVIWDRRSVLAPAVRQMEGLREREEKLEAALKEYARKAPELAESLKKMGLLCTYQGDRKNHPCTQTNYTGQIT